MNLAHKYASAFLKVYNEQLIFDDIERINAAADFLDKHRRALFLLKVPFIKRAIKEKELYELWDRFALVKPVKKLIALLLDHKRSYLLAAVFKAIVYRYQKLHTIHTIKVTSSIELSEKYRGDIEAFVDQQLSGTKLYRYEVDQKLIAGIRLQSDTILWEFSIDKSLRELAHVDSW